MRHVVIAMGIAWVLGLIVRWSTLGVGVLHATGLRALAHPATLAFVVLRLVLTVTVFYAVVYVPERRALEEHPERYPNIDPKDHLRKVMTAIALFPFWFALIFDLFVA